MGITQAIGATGEEAACQWLQSQGYQLIERNWRCRLGEIDLIMKDGQTMVFVEVRVRNNQGFGSGLDTIGPAKQRKLCRAAEAYQQAHGYWGEVRIDAIGMTQNNGEWAVEHIENAIVG